ncbi:MAG: glycosyltransferase family 2 protein [Candidatus Omnitrophica bacterium]|nr:glycosyltransferase family 2 protein [Candidatus Omnitrophota bacterium]
MKDHISVCICTYRRNKTLEYLLRKLALQETGGLFDLSVVVVDNDAAGPAQEIVMRLGPELGLNISYGIEPEQTIPAARNHALRLAQGNYIGIIDDDEFPSQDWLIKMYRGVKKFDVDGVLGPIRPFFESQPPAWLVKSRICERPVYCTGTILRWNQTRTGNVLIKKEVFDKHHLSFDVRFETGGSDRKFFMQAMRAGCRFVAVEDAPVYEIVPPERWTRKYYLKRSLVNGINACRFSKSEMRGLSRITVPLKSTVALAIYVVIFPVCLCLGDHVMMNCLIRGGHHLSRLLAMMGIELVKKRDF